MCSKQLSPAEKYIVDKNRLSSDMASLAKKCEDISNRYISSNDLEKSSATFVFQAIDRMKNPVNDSFAGVLSFLGHNEQKYNNQELFEIYLSFYSPTLYIEGKSLKFAHLPLRTYAKTLFAFAGRDRTRFLTLLRDYNYNKEIVLKDFSDDYSVSLDGDSSHCFILSPTNLYTLCKKYLSTDIGFENGLNISAVDYEEIRIAKPDDLRLYKFISNTLAKGE